VEAVEARERDQEVVAMVAKEERKAGSRAGETAVTLAMAVSAAEVVRVAAAEVAATDAEAAVTAAGVVKLAVATAAAAAQAWK